ncbi:hypothetical protein [Paenibacillus sp. BC26]|uniref:hypothetical protein n=1 Tax=Paenibacillus sp. BC26 TaxID=1881032 RepID=UPI0008E85CA7|nr:hypothetical protein [Paenibacillus sp. BC26]SFS76312.1 hypothetical protein SAMN05428962_2711 [Paenibacillus sp. BC26]
MKNRFMSLVVILIFVFFLSACSSDSPKPFTPEDSDKITLEVTNRTEDLNGVYYTIKLTNKSSHIIKQNIVFISYPFKTDSGSKGNVFKVEAKNNKLDIKPKEEVILNAITPKKEFEDNKNILVNECYLEIKGYIDQVKDENHFEKTIGKQF